MSDSPVIWICKDIPGDHCGGPDCFCGAVALDPFNETQVAAIEAAIADGTFNATN